MTHAYLMGIDIGTTATKTIVIDEMGEVVAVASSEYPLSMPLPSWAEQDPQDWWRAVKMTVPTVLKQLPPGAKISGIGYSGQMHGMVALDQLHQVVRPCIIWADQRNVKQCEEIHARCGGVDGLLRMTNNRMLAGYTGGKILWFQQNEPELYQKTRMFLLPKDYIRFCMTGEYATEVSDASGTGLLDTRQRRWCGRLLELLEIDPGLLPPCYESAAVSAVTSSQTFETLGLEAGIPVIGGGGDAVIAMTGIGVIHPGDYGASLGTGGVIATVLDQPYDNPQGLLQISCNNMPEKWHVMGVTMGAGGAFRWIKEAVGDLEKDIARLTREDVYDILCREAVNVPAGSDGLLFMPHLFGTRCPHDDANSRGAFVGLTFNHQKAHLLRSVLEGVMFSFKDMSEVIRPLGGAPATIKVSGGGARSPLWRQIMADIFDCEVQTVSGAVHGGAYGSALLAGASVGVWSSLEEAASILKVETRQSPDESNATIYRKLLPVYQSLYEALKDSNHRLWI